MTRRTVYRPRAAHQRRKGPQVSGTNVTRELLPHIIAHVEEATRNHEKDRSQNAKRSFKTIPSGKHAGRTLPEILFIDPNWLFEALRQNVLPEDLLPEAENSPPRPEPSRFRPQKTGGPGGRYWIVRRPADLKTWCLSRRNLCPQASTGQSARRYQPGRSLCGQPVRHDRRQTPRRLPEVLAVWHGKLPHDQGALRAFYSDDDNFALSEAAEAPSENFAGDTIKNQVFQKHRL